MVCRLVRSRISALFLSLSTISFGAQFSIAGTVAALPLGTIITQGSVTVGNAAAPTGTTIFAGDKVSSSQPTLINFSTGSRMEITKAAATFSRQGKILIVKADQGLLRFSFKKGESVQIHAGKFQITGISDSSHVGELGLNSNGQIVMTVTEGTFSALNTETGTATEVTPTKPLAAADQSAAALGAGAVAGVGSVNVPAVVGAAAASTAGTIISAVPAFQSPDQK